MTPDSGPTGPNPPDAVPPGNPPPAVAPEPSAAANEPMNPTPPAVEPTPSGESVEARARRRGAHRPDSAWAAYRLRRTTKKQAKAKKPHRKAPWWELPALV